MSPNSSPIEQEVIRHVLRDRAHRASQSHATVEHDGTPLLTFSLGGETYAVEAARVREVMSAKPICRIPGADPKLRGVVNVRGGLVTVLDTCRLLDLPPDGRATSLLVLELPKLQLALQVAGPLDLALLDNRHRPGASTHGDESSCHRAVAVSGRLIGLIDPDRLLAALPTPSHRDRPNGRRESP